MIELNCKKTEEGIDFLLDKDSMPFKGLRIFIHKDDLNFNSLNEKALTIICERIKNYINKYYIEK